MAETNVKKMLLAEDDEGIRSVYKEYLSSEGGFKIDTAEDGEQAFEKISKEKYDVILLDIMMPKLTGLEVLEKFKSSKKKNGPVILLTNMSDKKSISEGLKLGAKDYIVKVDTYPDQVLEKIKEVVK